MANGDTDRVMRLFRAYRSFSEYIGYRFCKRCKYPIHPAHVCHNCDWDSSFEPTQKDFDNWKGPHIRDLVS